MQLVIVGVIVAGAAAYVLRNAWRGLRAFKQPRGCGCGHEKVGSCGGCPLSDVSKSS